MKKPSTAVLGQALELKPVLERAAALTNRPDLASEIATAWVAGLTDGGSKKEIGTFALQCEDVVGILLAAHDADSGQFGADLATDAAALSGTVTQTAPKPARTAAARWRQEQNTIA